MPDDRQLLVEIRNVVLRSDRGESIFSDLSLMVAPGESVMIAGPSGSGKSSMLDLILGRRVVSAGSVEVFGKLLNRVNAGKIRKMRRRIGGVGGPFGLIPSMTVAENVLLPLVISGERPVLQKERLVRTLAELGLSGHSNEYPGRLSRVQSTLVQVARSTIASQPLVLIDEPSAGLDKATSALVFEYLFKVAVSGRSLIIVASEMPEHQLPNCRRMTIAGGVLS